jgi:hypothetical protein
MYLTKQWLDAFCHLRKYTFFAILQKAAWRIISCRLMKSFYRYAIKIPVPKIQSQNLQDEVVEEKVLKIQTQVSSQQTISHVLAL